MFRKIQITFLILFSSVIIMLGGYNCAQKINYPSNQVVPIDAPASTIYPSEPLPYTGDYEDSLLPEEPSDSYCNRSQYDKLRKKHGSSSFVRFQSISLTDYRLGVETNFETNCNRMYLDMTENRNRYEGSLTISYEDGNNIHLSAYMTGRNENEIKYNKWVDKQKSPSRTGRLSSKFYAIFQDGDGALILNIDSLIERNIRDGATELIGSGEIWYKMFRSYAGKRDVCYSSGTYISKSKIVPRRPSARCWLLNEGPFSCKPQGVHSAEVKLTDNRDYDCFRKLGTFGNLDVREAFNVGSKDNPY